MSVFGAANSLEEQLVVAQAMIDLRAALTDEVMQPIMALMNTPLGFKTDRDPNQIDYKTQKPHVPYDINVVRECFIEARLRGYNVIGNEFNIIAGNFYATKNGLDRQCKNHDGVTDFMVAIGIPRLVPSQDPKDRGAIVPCEATWMQGGARQTTKADIPVKVNDRMGADAIIGKATRKILARAYAAMSGRNTPEAEVGDDPPLLQPAAAPALPAAPLFQGAPPPDSPPPAQTPPSPVSEQPQGTPAPAPAPSNAVTAAKQKIIGQIAEKMRTDNIGIDQIMVWLVARGDTHAESNQIEDVPTSRLVMLNAQWDQFKGEIAAIEV